MKCPYNFHGEGDYVCPCNAGIAGVTRARVWCKTHQAWHWKKDSYFSCMTTDSQSEVKATDLVSKTQYEEKQMEVNDELRKTLSEFESAVKLCSGQVVALTSFAAWVKQTTISDVQFTGEHRELIRKTILAMLGED